MRLQILGKSMPLVHRLAFTFVTVMYLYWLGEIAGGAVQIQHPLVLLWGLTALLGGLVYLVRRPRDWSARVAIDVEVLGRVCEQLAGEGCGEEED